MKNNGLAKASMVLGIVAISTSFLPIINNASFVMGVLAVIFGIITLVKKGQKGKAITGIVLGILAVAITLSLQQSWSESLNELSDDLDTISGENTDKVLNNVDVSLGTFICEDQGYGLFDTKLPVTITNKSSKRQSFSIQIEALDSNGNRIDTDDVYARNLAPGQTVNEEAFIFVSSDKTDAMRSATFKVIGASMY